ncbi:hypothetical protein CU669_05380 [Paramagnetospirillum kuznetsovii]|uniref:Uncharacterized protein n=1 Tax=Paramagnetospirillum kuznetsovii TaxID=2053833 RepID=A0A364P0F9_9PROT|nr:hypothetical protein [Paramagnetospirillum kuznetsovii]RAU22821.1 hypothetical protein CU669_05380 [Paramagnetospirillum kuznetsovii]
MPNLLRLLTAILFMLATGALAECPRDKTNECDARSPWYAANVVRLATANPNSSDTSRFTLSIHGQNTLTIDLDNRDQGQAQQGTVTLVEGRAMLTRGLTLPKGKEIDALDAPILTYQLLITLLNRSLPDGPDSLAGSRKVDLAETERPIQLATNSASIELRPPWKLTGTVSRRNSETLDYALVLTYATKSGAHVMSLDGDWSKLRQPPPFDDSMPLAGWRYHSLGVVVYRQDGATVLDYTDPSHPSPLSTLGELRASIIAQHAKP